MQIKCKTANLKQAVKLLIPVVNHMHPALSFRHLKVVLSGEKLEFKAFNNTIVASVFVTCIEHDTDMHNYYISAKNFFSLISSINRDEVNLKFSGTECVISFGKSKYKIVLLDENIFIQEVGSYDIDYYKIQHTNPPIQINTFLTNALSVVHMTAKEEYKTALRNVYLDGERIIACDGSRGAYTNYRVEALKGFLVHKTLIECISNINNSNELCLTLFSNRLFGKSENFLFAMSLEDITYPYEDIKPYINIDPTKTYMGFNLSAEETIEKLSRVLIFADSDTYSVKVNFDLNSVCFQVENNNNAEEYLVPLSMSGPVQKTEVFIDGRNLKETLSKAISDSVVWYIKDNDSAQYLISPDITQFFMGLNK